ncbi:hypothetical protein [Draconibacterium sediminis]|uniref:Uncharacterized protein n=1 Tax=Draconibacterium sediminis TaxID=1544798 RepID=A0A0D8JDY4_9BACT|nr:hypothetical protein [Draconibacterium sediminis]KJF44063.1 hypothetical protein LH29_00545 [Draconibacterium sediminis]
MAKDKTVLEILKELKNTGYNDISWAMKYYSEGQPEGLTVSQWVKSLELKEEEYKKIYDWEADTHGTVDLGTD